MKNKARVRSHDNLFSGVSQPQNNLAESANAGLDPKLEKQIPRLSPKDRSRIVQEMRQLLSQIERSVAIMNGTSLGAPAAPKIPKGFVQINLSTWGQKELRKLARECGCELRDLLRWALTHLYCDLKEKVALKRKTGWSLPEQARFFASQNDRN